MIAAAIGLIVGLCQGAVHLALLEAGARRYIVAASWGETLLLSLARLAVTGGLFWLVAQIGALPLLAALGGFLLARSIVLARCVFGHG